MIKHSLQLPNQTECILYASEEQDIKEKPIAIYFHGGGLIYGSKNDLPTSLIRLFLDKGIQVISIDYLLAPNTSVSDILADTFRSISHLLQEYFPSQEYYFVGRSAGSFLMFQMVKLLLEHHLRKPKKLVNFYGYDSLSFMAEWSHPFLYTAFPHSDFETPIKDDPQFERFLIYQEALKSKSLYQLLQKNGQEERFEIDEALLLQFPPTFHTASTSDLEIPFKTSKYLAKKIPNSLFIPVYYLEHDFLKLSHPEVEKVLEKLKDWIEQ